MHSLTSLTLLFALLSSALTPSFKQVSLTFLQQDEPPESEEISTADISAPASDTPNTDAATESPEAQTAATDSQPAAAPTTSQSYVYVVEDMDDGSTQTFTYPTADMSQMMDPLETYYILQDEDDGLFQALNYTDVSQFVLSTTP